MALGHNGHFSFVFWVAVFSQKALETICYPCNTFRYRLSGLLLGGFSTCIEFQWHVSSFNRKDFYSPVCPIFGGVGIIRHYIIACLKSRNVAICCYTFGEYTDLSSFDHKLTICVVLFQGYFWSSWIIDWDIALAVG